MVSHSLEKIALVAGIGLISIASAQAVSTISSPLPGGASTVPYMGVLSNLTVSEDVDVLLTGRWGLRLSANSGAVPQTYRFFIRQGGWQGFDKDASAWTLLGQTTVTNVVNGGLTTLDFNLANPFRLLAGQTYGITVLHTTPVTDGQFASPGAVEYWTSNAPVHTIQNDDLRWDFGVAKAYPFITGGTTDFAGSTIGPGGDFGGPLARVLVGDLEYIAADPIPEPATMLALGLGAAALAARRRRSQR